MEFTVITIRVLVSNIHVTLFVVLYLYSVKIQVRLSGHTPQLSQHFGVRLCLPATGRFEKFVERERGGEGEKCQGLISIILYVTRSDNIETLLR